ncbi:MAG: hypothetical protein DPW16_18640 [Chloroflexi bacterium]|nr:hypothetical protein [Chloroflexota bacterium]
MQELLEKLRQKCLAEGVELNQPAQPDEIDDFEKWFGIKFSADFRQYLLKCNGSTMSFDMSHLWALDDIKPVWEIFGNPSEDDNFFQDYDAYFVFGDYNYWGGFWAIKLGNSSVEKNSIVITYTPQECIYLADNYTQFLEQFINLSPHSLA